jgi:hypothetical protein
LFAINCPRDTRYFEKSIVAEGCNSSSYALKFESAVVTEFQAAQANSSLDLSKAKHGASAGCLSWKTKENVVARISTTNLIICGWGKKQFENGVYTEYLRPNPLRNVRTFPSLY